jgi:hypothetical protein
MGHPPGDAVPYRILSDDTHTVITSSAVHLAHDPNNPNLRVHPTFRSGDGESTVSSSIPMSASDLPCLDVESPDLKLPHFSPDELLGLTFTGDILSDSMMGSHLHLHPSFYLLPRLPLHLPSLSMFFDERLLLLTNLLALFNLRMPSILGFLPINQSSAPSINLQLHKINLPVLRLFTSTMLPPIPYRLFHSILALSLALLSELLHPSNGFPFYMTSIKFDMLMGRSFLRELFGVHKGSVNFNDLSGVDVAVMLLQSSTMRTGIES